MAKRSNQESIKDMILDFKKGKNMNSTLFAKISVSTVILLTIILSCSKPKNNDTNMAALSLLLNNSKAAGNTTVTSPIATIPNQLSYASSNAASTSGNIVVSLGNSITITNTTATVTGATVIYSVNPALPSGVTLDSATGHIAGLPTANQALTSYVVTATYTAQSGYKLSTAIGLTRTIKIYVGSSASITNLTCNATGTGTAIGCTSTFPYACTASVSCYASQASCYNSSDCIQ